MGEDTAGAADRALRLLNSPELRHPPATGPTQRRTTSTTPGAPLNLDQLDYVTEHFDEVITHAQAVAVDLPTPPGRDGNLYAWYVDSTGDANENDRLFRDALIERHRLEHAVRLGEYTEICKNPCPGCGCWGLEWNQPGRRAQCLNRKCRTPDGTSSSWTLARLAAQKIQRTEIWRRNAT